MARMIVTKAMTLEADREVRKLGARESMVKLSKTEPELIEHVNKGMERIWRKLKSYGLINANGMNGIDETLHPTILGGIISSLEALRKGQHAMITEMAQRRQKRPDTQEAIEGSVTADLLDEVETQYWPMGRDRAMRELHAVEPELQRFVVRVTTSVLDGLTGYQLPDSVRELLAEQVMTMAVICVASTKKSHPIH